jgi:hypothetical protein
MWQCAVELKAVAVQRYLAPRLGYRLPEEPRKRKESADYNEDIFSQANAMSSEAGKKNLSGRSFEHLSVNDAVEDAHSASDPQASRIFERRPSRDGDQYNFFGRASKPSLSGSEGELVQEAGDPSAPSDGRMNELSPRGSKNLTEAEVDEWRSKALRAVVQNDPVVIVQVLDAVHVDIWARWENKAGKDLLTLSLERGSTDVYPVLAKALGLLKEQKREVFEERETVWVMFNGEVQPHRATVIEDTPEEEDEILVEFWDDPPETPPKKVHRCNIRKIGG